MRPSRVPPSLAYWTWPRPCGIAITFSVRVSAHFTGRPSSLAYQPRHSSSG